MPSNTPKGLPYPLPTEPLADGAVAIKNLADAVDARIILPRAIHLLSTTPIVVANGAASTWATLNSKVAETIPPGGASLWSSTVNPSRVTIAENGMYACHAKVYYDPNATGFREISIVKSRVTASPVAYDQKLPTVSQSNTPHIECFGIVSCVAGDYIEMNLGQSSGGNLNANMAANYGGLRVWRIA